MEVDWVEGPSSKTKFFLRESSDLFSIFFPFLPTRWKRLNSAIFWSFFHWPPLGNFSADALECKYHLKKTLRKALQDTTAVAKTNLY